MNKIIQHLSIALLALSTSSFAQSTDSIVIIPDHTPTKLRYVVLGGYLVNNYCYLFNGGSETDSWFTDLFTVTGPDTFDLNVLIDYVDTQDKCFKLEVYAYDDNFTLKDTKNVDISVSCEAEQNPWTEETLCKSDTIKLIPSQSEIHIN